MYTIVYKVTLQKKLLLNLFRKRRILLLFLPDSSGQQHSFVLEWMCLIEFELCHFYNFFWILSFEYFCRVLFVVCVLFTSKFAGSRKGLMHSLMWLSLFFLVFSFFSLQLINRRTLEIRVDFSSPAIKNLKKISFSDWATHFFLTCYRDIFFWHYLNWKRQIRVNPF